MFGAPAAHGRRNVEPHPAFGGKLEGVRQQVLQHLLQTLRVGDNTAPQIGIDIDVERQLAVFGLVPERASHGFQKIGCENFLCIHGHGARFDLGQVEDVADQIEQVGAGAMNGSRKLDLLGR